MSLKKQTSKKDHVLIQANWQGEREIIESHVSLNIGLILNVWYSLVLALSSLRKSEDSNVRAGLEILGRMNGEIDGMQKNAMPEDEVVRYFISQIAIGESEIKTLMWRIDSIRQVLEKIEGSQSVKQEERLRAENVLLKLLDQLKPIAKRHQDKFTSLMLGTEVIRE